MIYDINWAQKRFSKYLIKWNTPYNLTTARTFYDSSKVRQNNWTRQSLWCIALLISIYEVNSPPPLASAHAQAAHTKYVPSPLLSPTSSVILSLSLFLSYASKCLTSAKTIRYEVCLHFRKFCTLAITKTIFL